MLHLNSIASRSMVVLHLADTLVDARYFGHTAACICHYHSRGVMVLSF